VGEDQYPVFYWLQFVRSMPRRGQKKKRVQKKEEITNTRKTFAVPSKGPNNEPPDVLSWWPDQEKSSRETSC